VPQDKEKLASPSNCKIPSGVQLPPAAALRRSQAFGGRTWEIDVFHGDNEGLVVAEVEVTAESEPVQAPPWLGREVSSDPRYLNSNLIANPYKNWRADDA
jgi:adenylate cyclase